MARLQWLPALRQGPLWVAALLILTVSPAVHGQVIEVLEGASYGPVVMLPETEVVFGYTILCAADLPWGSDPCPDRTLGSAGPPAADGAATGEPGDAEPVFHFGALTDLSVDPLAQEETLGLGAAAPLQAGGWALYARLVPHWAFDGEVAVRAAHGPPSPSQAFIPLGHQPVELMRFESAAAEDIYVEIKVKNRFSVPMSGGYLLGVEFRVARVR